MGASAEQIRRVVAEYVRLLAAGRADDVVALYAEDATVEDPVGSDLRVGRAAISRFYASLDDLQQETRLIALRVAGGEAAVHFEVVTRVGETTYTVAPIDVMTFDDEGRISSMRAYWGDADLVVS